MPPRRPASASPEPSLESLAASLASMSGMLDLLPIGIFMVDASMRPSVVNRAAKSMLGLPESMFANGLPSIQALLERLAHALPPEAAAENQRRFLALAMKLEPQRFDLRGPGGTILEAQGLPTPEGGFLATWTDVTGVRKLEARAAAKRAKIAKLEEINKEWESINQELLGAHCHGEELARRLPAPHAAA